MQFKVWSWDGPSDWTDLSLNKPKQGVLLEEIEADTIVQACGLAINKYPDKCLRVSGAGFAIEIGAGSDPQKLVNELDGVMCNL